MLNNPGCIRGSFVTFGSHLTAVLEGDSRTLMRT